MKKKSNNTNGNSSKTDSKVTSFKLTPSDEMSLSFFEKYYGLNRSAIIRKLLDEKYGEIKGKQHY